MNQVPPGGLVQTIKNFSNRCFSYSLNRRDILSSLLGPVSQIIQNSEQQGASCISIYLKLISRRPYVCDFIFLRFPYYIFAMIYYLPVTGCLMIYVWCIWIRNDRCKKRLGFPIPMAGLGVVITIGNCFEGILFRR